ncbi:hypothetical protein CEUSTIGMA_g528.t1 [Chlamydomonas eustigma]|uniref:FAST kinase leucine-rich domain-containing protein n=1 Tax=Chlamydomonas eustigma TaxID=1157962 RepID=A0A250WQF3_9CHLO|nr:hypothetical protein CEUSTIGMA_g528.t1 [Chlamydomonas eustigma]|eukprot:GAX73075.1 hypothetical protein CEUSTIGMA_g528.t1 [Chlamydomonas eustigma]
MFITSAQHPFSKYGKNVLELKSGRLSASLRPMSAPYSRWMPLQNMGMGQLADCIHSCATVGVRPSNSFFSRYTTLTRPRLHHLRPRQLSVVIRSMVALEYLPDEDWLSEFDSTCFSHPGHFDAQSAVQVLAGMATISGASFSFPQAVYLTALTDPCRFTKYNQLACLLHCLGSHNVPLWDEPRFLEVVGSRMGQLLAKMSQNDAQHAVLSSLCRSSTMQEILMLETGLSFELEGDDLTN